MKYPQVTHLYKYCTYNTNSLSILINRKIWVAKPESFNDPFDCLNKFNTVINDESLRKFIKRNKIEVKNYSSYKQGFIKQLKKTEDELDSDIGVFSMSSVGHNSLMWSHYADEHRGFCIEFVRKPGNNLGNFEMTKPVEYKRNFPKINILDSDGCMNKYVHQKKYFVKDEDWKYEKEWRLTSLKGNKAEDLPSDISSVIFGLKIPQEHRDTIQNILSGQGISYKEAVKAEHQFKIKIIDLTE